MPLSSSGLQDGLQRSANLQPIRHARLLSQKDAQVFWLVLQRASQSCRLVSSVHKLWSLCVQNEESGSEDELDVEPDDPGEESGKKASPLHHPSITLFMCAVVLLHVAEDGKRHPCGYCGGVVTKFKRC